MCFLIFKDGFVKINPVLEWHKASTCPTGSWANQNEVRGGRE